MVNTGREAGWEPGQGDVFGIFGNCVTAPDVREKQDRRAEGRGKSRAWGMKGKPSCSGYRQERGDQAPCMVLGLPVLQQTCREILRRKGFALSIESTRLNPVPAHSSCAIVPPRDPAQP